MFFSYCFLWYLLLAPARLTWRDVCVACTRSRPMCRVSVSLNETQTQADGWGFCNPYLCRLMCKHLDVETAAHAGLGLARKCPCNRAQPCNITILFSLFRRCLPNCLVFQDHWTLFISSTCDPAGFTSQPPSHSHSQSSQGNVDLSMLGHKKTVFKESIMWRPHAFSPKELSDVYFFFFTLSPRNKHLFQY